MIAKPALIELQNFPSVQYFSKFLLYPTIILEQQESYRKGSFRNRCHIASANGLLRLSIPLEKGKNQQQAIREVRISYAEAWQNKHWTAIQSAYGNAPYFEFYADSIYPFFKKRYDFLFDYNLAVLHQLLTILQLPATVQLSQTFMKSTNAHLIDLRNSIHPTKSAKDSNYKVIPYAQVFQEKTGFLPNLSILDLIFCQGPESSLIIDRSLAKS